MLVLVMWTLSKSRRNDCGHSKTILWVPGERETVEVEREKEPTGYLLSYVQSVAEAISTTVKGFVNPPLIPWMGNKGLNKIHTADVFPCQGTMLNDHQMEL